MARPSKLTPELQERLCALIATTACSLEAAAAAVGVDDSTIKRWRARGLIEETGPFRAFCAALSRARARSEAPLAAIVAKAAQQDWRAAAWILERRFPDTWGAQVNLVRRFERMSEEELDAYLTERLAEMDREPEG